MHGWFYGDRGWRTGKVGSQWKMLENMETKQRTQLAARHQSLVTSNIQPAGVSNTDKLQHCHQRVCTGAMRVGMAQLDISLFIHVISIGKTYPL